MNSTNICPDVVPKYYTVTLTLMTIISFPINSTGVWLVWFHSPQMGKFKYCLMYLQVITFMTENWSSYISPGYYFFPMLAGFNLSYLGELMTGHTTMVIWVFIFCFELPSLFICFMYRHDAAIGINNSKNTLKYLNYFTLFVAHLLPPFTATTLQLSLLTYDQKYNLLKTKYPQCLHFADNRLFEIYDWNINSWIAICGIGSFSLVLIVVSYGFGLVIHTMHILHKLRVHMSAETFKMHKSALISLSMQCVIPSLFLIVPMYTLLVIVAYQINDLHEYSNCAFFGICSHSCISTIVMITTNSKYLTTLRNKLKPGTIFQKVPIQKRSNSISVSMPRTMSIVQA
ncbi:unnamed protein product [Caenorhabditis angaria]|uniref:Serpentine Receptor, class I n=1 Tax=Caenorhabditis angaria TaxID=860376 RepID=A0A9P1MSY0_9PELO|nr:unnamed protein product [Caenorhabditis angaria]